MFSRDLGQRDVGANSSFERLMRFRRKSFVLLLSVFLVIPAATALGAGNVEVVVSDGDLRIDGDDQSNEVRVIATEVFGAYVVQGVGGTRINGVQNDTINVSGVNDDIRIDMRDGNNEIALVAIVIDNVLIDLVVPDDLVIHNGSGRIGIITQDVQVADDLRIHTHDGSDAILLSETEVGNDLEISTHEGNDDVLLDVVRVGDDVAIDVGEGRNLVSIDESLIVDDLTITGGHSRSGDTISIRDETAVGDDLRIYAHAGNDDVCMVSVATRTLHIHMGDDNDRLDLGFVDVDEQTRLNGDRGFDTLGEESNSLNGLRIRTFEQFDDFVDCLDEDE